MSGVSRVVLHPQAILQVADIFSRMEFLAASTEYVCGLLLGSAEGNIEVVSSIESVLRGSGLELSLDMSVYRTLFRLYRAIYPSLVPVGWYSCKPLSPDQVQAVNAAFNVVDHPAPFVRIEIREGDESLAVFAQHGDGWVPSEYVYESELAERIAMMQLQREGTAESQVAFTADAFRTLDRDLEMIEKYLTTVATGDAPFDPVLVRRCGDIALWWIHKDDDDNAGDIEKEQLAILVGMMADRITSAAVHLRIPRKRVRIG
jgi:hypothetical protein